MRVLEFREVNNSEEFIEFWSQRYSERDQRLDEQLYDNNIGQPLTEDRVRQLFKWKNGMDVSAPKQQSIKEVYLPRLAAIPERNNRDAGRQYLEQLGGGPIWGIFWLHCIKPSLFPIFDQHTYRAMAAMTNMEVKEIPPARSKIIGAYFECYIPFLNNNFHDVQHHRSIGKALLVYGRFLKTEFNPRK